MSTTNDTNLQSERERGSSSTDAPADEPTAQQSATGQTGGASGTRSYGTLNQDPTSGRSSQMSSGSSEPLHRHRALGQDPEPSTPRSKRPPTSRRTSSRFPAPYRGQEFSIDDDPDEYHSDYQVPRSGPGHPQSLRTQTSTVRRRQAPQTPGLAPVESVDEEPEEGRGVSSGARPDLGANRGTINETTEAIDSGDAVETDADVGEEDDGDVSDAESFTLKDRQQAINQTHPFGIRIWKPAVYKKNRSVEKNAEGDIHSAPGGRVNKWLWLFNLLWTLFFGWWLALIAAVGGITCLCLAITVSGRQYGYVLWGLAGYLFYPFGKFVKLEQDETYAEEDEGEGRSITEYEQWQSGDLEDGRLFFGPTSRGLVGARRGSMDSADENDSLLGHERTGEQQDQRDIPVKRRLFGRGQWTIGRVIFFIFFYFLIAPLLLVVSGLCWFMVFWIPMGRVTALLFYHLRRHPLALSFHSDAAYSRGGTGSSTILLCTYRAVGSKYWKYTVDGTNIFFINLMAVVLFVVLDYFILDEWLGLEIWLTHPGFLFMAALASIIPLAYFIGQAVASISAQSSMGLGAAINAFFSTVVEVFLYCVALQQGKGQLVEGSIMGSIFAGVLLMPGLSMAFGALHRKTQRFNIKSAGVTSTMLLFAMITAFGPTLFYQIYGSHELKCSACVLSNNELSMDSDCRRCFYTQVPAINDRFFTEAVQPYCWFAAVLLFLSYLIGLWFTLRTHAAVIWNNEPEEKKTVSVHAPNGAVPHPTPTVASREHRQNSLHSNHRGSVRDSQLYKRILNQSLNQIGLNNPAEPPIREEASTSHTESVLSPPPSSPYIIPPKTDGESMNLLKGLSREQNVQLARQVAEIAATAASVAANDVAHTPQRKRSLVQLDSSAHPNDTQRKSAAKPAAAVAFQEETAGAESEGHGGHDAPNWGRTKSAVILLAATVLYAIVAEILVDTVDVVLENVDIDEKFLGITLFALVPNTTEFLNAISFALNGNIALSMEIGSAYALQVCLLQVPALVFFSAVHGRFVHPSDLMNHTFNLLFPQWDMVTVILCVILFTYVYGEGKSNYFKGSILCLTYLVVIVGYYLSGLDLEAAGINRFELVGHETTQSFKTIGRTRSGVAY